MPCPCQQVPGRCWTSTPAMPRGTCGTASRSDPQPASNSSPLVGMFIKHAICDVHTHARRHTFCSSCCCQHNMVNTTWSTMHRLISFPDLTAPLRKAATELFKVTGISNRSDNGSEHESRLSASFASFSGFDGVLNSLTLEESSGRSPSLSRTQSYEAPRRARWEEGWGGDCWVVCNGLCGIMSIVWNCVEYMSIVWNCVEYMSIVYQMARCHHAHICTMTFQTLA